MFVCCFMFSSSPGDRRRCVDVYVLLAEVLPFQLLLDVDHVMFGCHVFISGGLGLLCFYHWGRLYSYDRE